MSENINNQFDFFKLVNLDANGNIGVTISGGTDNDNFTTGTTVIGDTIYFDRTNGLSAYTADISSVLLWETSTGPNSLVPFGSANVASGPDTIAIGNGNTSNGAYSAAIGGQGHTNNGDLGFMAGGAGNTIVGEALAILLGGAGNSLDSEAGSIIGGQGQTNNGNNSSIVGGTANNINSDASGAFIGGGDTNSIVGYPTNVATTSAIIGGSTNDIDGAKRASIIGGNDHLIKSGSTHSAIIGGQSNDIQANSESSIIVGGQINNITSGVTNSVIIGGTNITGSADNTAYVPNLVVKTSITPSASGDTAGEVGNISYDATYAYFKTTTGWGRISLDYGF